MQKIGLVCRKNLEKHKKVFERLFKYLLKKEKTVYLEDRVAQVMEQKTFNHFDLKQTKVDLVLALGGDGTILRVISKIKSLDTKFLGINMGHLGFLSEIPPTQIQKTLDTIFAGKFTSDQRMLLNVSLHQEKKQIKHLHALNEVVVSQGSLCRLIHLKAKVDGRKLANYNADGLMVCTPTGSTAYNLSAGGPIVHPAINAMILTPISPHSFNQKPIVIPGDKKIEIKVSSDYNSMNMTLDGQMSLAVHKGDVLKIKKGPNVTFLRLPTENYFLNLRNKLGWGERIEKVY